jgi:hypothetical protein
MTLLMQRSVQRRAVTAAALLLLVAGAPATVTAQSFPTTIPTEVFRDDFESTDPLTGPAGSWTVYQEPATGWANWTKESGPLPAQAAGGLWGSTFAQENRARDSRSTVLVINKSMPGDLMYNPLEWSNNRIEFDFAPDELGTAAPGVAFGLHDDDGLPGLEAGYYFWIDNIPTAAEAGPPERLRATWHLVRDKDGTFYELGTGVVELDPGDPDLRTVVRGDGQAYRVRVEFFCSNMRIQIQRLYNPVGREDYWGCGPCTNPEDCWCTILEYYEDLLADPTANLMPGGVGLYSRGSTAADATNRFDNMVVSSWGESCIQVCSPWYDWTSSWNDEGSPALWDTGLPHPESEQMLAFKYLYEGSLLDFSYGRNAPVFQIDVDVRKKITSDDARNVSSPASTFCDGMNLKVDLPPPASAITNIDDVRAFLQPAASSVDFVPGSSELFAGGNFVPNFDNDPASGTFDPIPIVARGSTPIANSLWDAYDWYVNHQETEPWATDPLARCRLWYVVLITDGEESCGLDLCGPGSVAEAFSTLEDAVPVYTVGYAGGFQVDVGTGTESPVACVSNETGGQFYTADNANALSAALYSVLNAIDARDRSFVPFKVAPPPSPSGTGPEDFLAVFPFFTPLQDRPLWEGHLYGFKLNADNPTLPTVADSDCEIDFTQIEWNAADSLLAQLSGSPQRNIFIGWDSGSDWVRCDITETFTNATLRSNFKDYVSDDLPVTITDLQAVEVANFVRNIYDNPAGLGLSPPPQDPPRAGGTPVLGDIYHSQPKIVNPPTTTMYFYDYGFVEATELGVHDYQLFMQEQSKRRRVVLVGGNDGILHGFDGGAWDRDDGGVYDDVHDLGTGTEMFGFVPQAVMHRLYNMTYGTDQQYLVDGQTTVADVFISPDGVGDREWRTIALSTMRRGGRGMVALDITQPDSTSGTDYVPSVPSDDMPGCLTGGTGCAGNYPELLWEFIDTTDANSNCPPALSGDECEPYWDLGWTWSEPAVARVAVYTGVDTPPDDLYIAFFGGGWDQQQQDYTGTHVYGVNVETGEIVFKNAYTVSIPGGVMALDSDLDGFHDRIYFGDTDGGLWRLTLAGPSDSAAEGIVGGALTGVSETKIFDFSADFPTRLDAVTLEPLFRSQFFARPISVPAGFDAGQYKWALAIGTGDRANLGDRSPVVDIAGGINESDHFFFVLDVGDDVTRTASDLVSISYADLDGTFDCDSSALTPADGNYGWYLELREDEKVNFEAKVIDGYVLFPTFEATDELADEPPDLCPGSGFDFGDETPEDQPICRAAGIGRAYKLWFECGQGETVEINDIITGTEDYTIDGKTYVTFTVSEAQPGYTEEFTSPRGYELTNWRQE